jgi:hypothetical protein
MSNALDEKLEDLSIENPEWAEQLKKDSVWLRDETIDCFDISDNIRAVKLFPENDGYDELFICLANAAIAERLLSNE